MDKPLGAPLLHLADVYEAVADAIPDARVMAWRGVERTWAEFEDRAARLAQAMTAAGLTRGSVVALYLHNSPAYLEGQFATLKFRGTPINANYRYVADELAYLLDNCDAEAVIYDGELADRVAAVAGKLPKLKLLIEVGDSRAAPGSHTLEELIAANGKMARIERSPDDLHMTYTGGTTGMPKGVRNAIGKMAGGVMMIAAGGLGAAVARTHAQAGDLAKRLRDEGRLPVSVVTPPFMHATGMVYGSMAPMMAGGCCVMLDDWSFTAEETLSLIQRERATSLTIAGDVMARPISAELEAAAAAGRPYDISSLRAVYSAGMIWTAPTKRVILKYAPDATLIDVVGSSEGHVGTSFATRDNIPDTGVFTPNATTKVLRADGSEIAPGSGERGLLACAGPITGTGYHKDPEKSAKTYKAIGGVNYVMAGDWATIEADGSIRFLGRDSSCINTGGEKVFAEEVENLILRMPGVADAIVVGVPDERFGESVAAVVKAAEGVELTHKAIQDWVRTELAGYKVPRHIVITDDFPRSPNGKSDIQGAKRTVQARLEPAVAS
ncbi:MAG: Acyl-CoA synthetase [Caulobacter sp.]|nr:Acyl-CoA synthetase [Caulobacter sp.]